MRLKHTRAAGNGEFRVLSTQQYDAHGGIQGSSAAATQHTAAAASPTRTCNSLVSAERSKINPRMLRSNATSHIWAFGALAELVDNAQDNEAKATRVWISGDVQPLLGETITIKDDGVGMTRDKLHSMLSFGFSDKENVEGNVGRFGMGFKSGSIRLGDDVLVLTREHYTTSLVMMSLTFLEKENWDDVVLPMLTWNLGDNGELWPAFPQSKDQWQWCVEVITKYSFLRSEQEILSWAKGRDFSGTTITIFNLRQPREFIFEKDDFLLLNPDAKRGNNKPYQQDRNGQQETLLVKLDYSLRTYLEILYLEPRVEIFLQGQTIKFLNPRMTLVTERHEFAPYTPKLANVTGHVQCWFGYNQDFDRKLCGTHIYNKNRLIKTYQRFGSQLQNNCMMKDLLGVAVADCLTPTHNKQDFKSNVVEYARFKNHLVKCMNEYYFDLQTHHMAGRKGRKPRRVVEEESEISDAEDDLPGSDDEGSRGSRKRRKVLDFRTSGGVQQQAAKPPQEEWRVACSKLRAKISRNLKYTPFKEPVDPVKWGCFDYYEVIKEPMDLKTVGQNLKTYNSPLQFKHDMLQIVENAHHYNAKDDPVFKLASQLKDEFLEGWDQIMEKIPNDVLRDAPAEPGTSTGAEGPTSGPAAVNNSTSRYTGNAVTLDDPSANLPTQAQPQPSQLQLLSVEAEESSAGEQSASQAAGNPGETIIPRVTPWSETSHAAHAAAGTQAVAKDKQAKRRSKSAGGTLPNDLETSRGRLQATGRPAKAAPPSNTAVVEPHQHQAANRHVPISPQAFLILLLLPLSDGFSLGAHVFISFPLASPFFSASFSNNSLTGPNSLRQSP
mmetsp:Transcript_30267/g.85548  ORF Transcript_30267/g.85548 Transcript_30267/m.85548 type:complete len:835 (+) Transcript_30267:242-2746(+)|eukprot:CAMPEP_0117651048 /NCGR_PEP_ID=MMETSP0804-20121206/1881_1 /TAXON_ID=1074897 /ORGANISM="Tetraselmis astigmatica, Strain CCMP880" /LENGTH=834 /DNA_ID=CAMNT_0005456993 /DNA_START=508 /DNA_END=3012 /DNA_ORIENTATION=-